MKEHNDQSRYGTITSIKHRIRNEFESIQSLIDEKCSIFKLCEVFRIQICANSFEFIFVYILYQNVFCIQHVKIYNTFWKTDFILLMKIPIKNIYVINI